MTYYVICIFTDLRLCFLGLRIFVTVIGETGEKLMDLQQTLTN